MGGWNSDKVITWKMSVTYFRVYSGTDWDMLRKKHANGGNAKIQ